MKLALILTGHVRQGVPLSERFKQIADLDPDIYVSTWNVRNSGNSHLGGRNADDFSEITEETIYQCCPANNVKKIKIIDSQEYQKNKPYDLIPLDREGDILRGRNEAEILLVKRLVDMWYCVRQAYDLFTEEQFYSYDCILKMRFDVRLHSHFPIDEYEDGLHMDDHLIYSPDGLYGVENKILVLSYQFAWGRPEYMKKYLLFYDFYPTAYEALNLDVGCAGKPLSHYLYEIPPKTKVHIHGGAPQAPWDPGSVWSFIR